MTTVRSLSVRLALLAVIVCASAWPLPARAQVADEQDAVKRLVAREIVRTALIDLRSQTQPGPGDYAAASAMLGIARSLTPDDANLLRRHIESERAAGHEQRVMQLTRELVRLDPSDTVAQLRLLSWNVSQKQTVEERLAVYDRYLGPDGQKAISDPAVRSRLALDAALLHREEGNEKEFVRLLSLATSLDSSNKEAAALASAFYQERRSDPVAILELAINVLRADPIDPNLHFAVAATLANHGVFDQSQRFHNNARRLIAADGVTRDAGIETEASVLVWQTAGPEQLVATLERQLFVQREAARLRIEQLEKIGQPTEGVDKPEDVRLPIYTERVRVLAALAAQDDVVIERSLQDLAKSVRPELEDLSERMNSPSARENDQLMNMLISRAASITTELVVARLIAGQETQVAAQDLEQMRPVLERSAQAQVDVLESLVVLRQGRVEEAIERFEPLSEISTLGSVGLGLALEAAGRQEEAAEAFKKAALFSPVSPVGAYARSMYRNLVGEELVFSEHTVSMRRVAEDVPRWFDQMTADPNRFMAMTARLVRNTIDPYEQPIIELEIRNTAPIALGVGSDRPINSRLMIAPSMDIASFPMDSVLQPEVADMQQRIRLTPGESFRMQLWPDPGLTGWIAELKSAHRVRNRWGLIQGFEIGQRQIYIPGPMCLSTETGQLTRRPDERVRANMSDLIRELELYEDTRLIRLLPTIRAALTDPDRLGGPPSAEDVGRVAGVLASRYPSLSREAKLAVIAIAPHSILCPGMEQLDQRLLAETDPALLTAAILTRVKDAGDPALSRAEASDDPTLSGLARVLKARLEAEEPKGFALMGSPGSHLPAPPEHPEAIEPE
ncbi:MAG: tetratricopeptide repeat protein [Phycisphaerales bacterium JB061]